MKLRIAIKQHNIIHTTLLKASMEKLTNLALSL